MDLASLGIRVTTQGVQEAEKQLDDLAKTGATTAQQTQKVAPAVESVGKAAARTAPALKQAALSARELQFATRQLPLQFTDMVTGLASGQRPLQVLLQQGGQLKDTFGGIGPAAQAMGGYIRGLINPFTLAAAAVVGLGVAWNKAEGEAANFQKALILTGNQAGLTAAELEALARSLDKSTSVTQGKASAVLAQVAATGQFTAEQIELVAKAAIAMEEATGRAVEETVKEFASLKGDPVDAILKLNDAIGDGTNVTKFLTRETLEQIKALKEQGREAEATDLAMRALFGAIEERAPLAVQQMTTLQLLVKDMKGGARELGDGFVNAFRRGGDAAGDFLRRLGAVLETMGPLGAAINRVGGAYAASLSARQATADPFVHVIDPRNPASMNIRPPSRGGTGGIVDGERERARIAFEREGLRFLDEQARKKRDIADVQKLINNGVVSQAEGEKRIAQINADYAERAAKRERKPRAISDRDSGASLLQQIREQIALTEQEAIAGEKLTASDRLRVQMQSLLANEKSKVSAATREALDVSLKELEAAERYKEIAEVNALIDAESARQQNEIADARERHADSIAALIDDMEFELSLIGLSNVERARMIALRHANADATSVEGQRIAELAEQLERAHEAEQITLDLKFAAEDMFAGFVSGSQSAGDAFEDFAKRLQRIAAQILAEKAVQGLLNMFGNMLWSDGQGQSGTFSFFSKGGYTGHGDKHEPAGIVHKGEVVWSQDDVRRAGGVGVVEAMRLRGYADGGIVGMYASPARSRQAAPEIEFNVINNSSAEVGKPEVKFDEFGKLIVNMAVNEVDRRINTMGTTGRAMQQRFGLQPQGVTRG
jgi:hypothetical protein